MENSFKTRLYSFSVALLLLFVIFLLTFYQNRTFSAQSREICLNATAVLTKTKQRKRELVLKGENIEAVTLVKMPQDELCRGVKFCKPFDRRVLREAEKCLDENGKYRIQNRRKIEAGEDFNYIFYVYNYRDVNLSANLDANQTAQIPKFE